MSIRITEILGTDSVPTFKDIVNNNFIKISEAIDNYSEILDLDGKSIKIDNIVVKNGIKNTTDTLIETNGSILSGGNITCAGSLSGSGLKIRNGVIQTNNNISLSSTSSVLTNMGNTILDGELILSDMTSSIIDASNELTYRNNQGTNNLVIVDNQTVGGKISSTGRSVLIIDWSKFLDNDPQFYLKSVLLDRPVNEKTGQILKIISKINEDIALPIIDGTMGYSILKDTLAYTTTNPINKGIFFTKSHQSVELIFNGMNWNILNIYGATVI